MQTIQKECLDQVVIFGTKHLDHLCREFVVHHHEERPHQSLDTELLVKPPNKISPAESITMRNVRCRQRLRGLLKSYRRKAA